MTDSLPDYAITTEKDRIDVEAVYNYLSGESYWAKGRPRETVVRSIDNSLCFSVLVQDRFAGFARAVTDYATFAYIADLFILSDHRGKGLGKKLVEYIVAHPPLQGIGSCLLATTDAHGLYERHGGFARLGGNAYYMQRSLKP